MALLLDEQFSDFEPENFRKIGERFSIPHAAVDSMLKKVAKGVGEAIRAQAPPIPGTALREMISRIHRLGAH